MCGSTYIGPIKCFWKKIADFCESKHEIPGDALGEVYEYGINVKDIKEKSL